MTTDIKHCCNMRAKVAIGIAKVFTKKECGLSDIVMADFHDFQYESTSNLPVAAALSIRFCPWCGTERTFEAVRRTTEIIR
jgi:hypothetical protein